MMKSESNPVLLFLLIVLAIFLWPIGIPALIIYFFNTGSKSLPAWSASERAVSKKLNELNPVYYSVIDNISLPSTGNTTITQIDHIVVSIYGVFCLETKSHKGWIFGSTNSKYWTQVLYHDRYKFYNPLWQNYGHKKSLETLLGRDLKQPVVSLVVFPNADKLKVDGSNAVGDLTAMIEKIQSHLNVVYDFDECNDIVDSIMLANVTDVEMIEQHKVEIRSLVNQTT